jgi:hypothetical protein
MKKSLLAAIVALALVGQVDSLGVSSLAGPYENLDSIVMWFYKPLIWWVVLSWSRGAACDYILSQYLETFITNDSLSDDD